MSVKSVSGKRALLGLLGLIGAYALFSFLGALLCLWEVAGEDEMILVYFAIGLLGVFFGAILMKKLWRVKKIWAAVISLALYALIVLLCREGETAAMQVWTYPGCGVGAVGALFWETGKKRVGSRRGVKRRKK